MKTPQGEAEPQFSQPFRQIFLMVAALGLVAAGSVLAYPAVAPVFLANPYLNGFIMLVFVIGVIACFAQVLTLISSVQWIEGFATERVGHENVRPPQLGAARRSRGLNAAGRVVDAIHSGFQGTRIDEIARSRDISSTC